MTDPVPAPEQQGDPASWMPAAYEEERRKFQRETLRTSALTRLLREAADLLLDDHAPGAWSRDCPRCALVARVNRLSTEATDVVLGIQDA